VSKLSFAAIAALTLTLGGCTRRGATAPEPRWSAQDTAALVAEIDALQDRLIADQARVWFWSEMRERHADVSAVACTNLGEHAVAMARAEERRQALLGDQKRRRVAMASPR
jgi:hypothetical protein